MKSSQVQFLAILIIGAILVFIALNVFELTKDNAHKLGDMNNRVDSLEDAIANVAVNTHRAALGTGFIIDGLGLQPSANSEPKEPVGFKYGQNIEV